MKRLHLVNGDRIGVQHANDGSIDFARETVNTHDPLRTSY